MLVVIVCYNKIRNNLKIQKKRFIKYILCIHMKYLNYPNLYVITWKGVILYLRRKAS